MSILLNKWFDKSFLLGLLIALVTVVGFGFNLQSDANENIKDIANICAIQKEHATILKQLSENQVKLTTLLSIVNRDLGQFNSRELSNEERLRKLEILINAKRD